MFHKVPSIIFAAAAFAAFTIPASAQGPRHRHPPRVAEPYIDERPPLTVNKRSFLDPGPVPAIEHGPNYVTTKHDLRADPRSNFLEVAVRQRSAPAAA